MRSFFKRALGSLKLLGVPLVMLTVAFSMSTAARAERDEGDFIARAFKSSDEATERRTERRSERTTRARRVSTNRQESSEDSPAPSSRRRAKGTQVASLGGRGDFSAPRPSRSLSGGGNVRWAANADCLNGTLRSAVANVAANYGSVTVNSTCRSRGHNARVGGAPKSYHLSGDAVDLRVSGNISGAARYLASLGGGYKHYGGGLFHVDTGPRRSF